MSIPKNIKNIKLTERIQKQVIAMFGLVLKLLTWDDNNSFTILIHKKYLLTLMFL